MRRILTLVAATAIGLPGAVHAQAVPGVFEAAEENGTAAHVILVGSCKIFAPGVSASAVKGGRLSYLTSEMKWSGACTAQGLADGRGVFRLCYRYDGNEGCSVYEGMVRNGLLEGRVFEQFLVREGASMVKNPNSPDAWNEYKNGCRGIETCDPAAALRLQAKYLAARAASTAPGGQQAARSTGSTSGTGDTATGGVSGASGASSAAGGASRASGTSSAAATSGAGNRKAMDAVAAGLLNLLGPSGSGKFASNQAMTDAVVANLRTSLMSGGANSAVGGDQQLLNLVLGTVRDRLGGEGGGTGKSSRQLVDLVMALVEEVIASNKPAMRTAAPAPAPARTVPAAADTFGQRLTQAGLKYEMDKDGDYKILFKVGQTTRTQLIYVSGGTQTIDGMAIREFFSPAAKLSVSVDGAKALELLAESHRKKVGSWEAHGDGLTYTAKVLDSISAKDARSLLETIVNIADEAEAKLTGKDDY